VVVENDHQVVAGGFVDDDVHDLLRRLASERGVVAVGVVDTAGSRRAERLNRERHANRVEALRFDLRQHPLVIPCPEAVGCVVRCFKAEPVDALQHDLIAGRVNDLVALSFQRRKRRGL